VKEVLRILAGIHKIGNMGVDLTRMKIVENIFKKHEKIND